MRRRRDEHLDSRITERSIVLFRIAKTMIAKGFSFDANAPVPSTRAVMFTDPGLHPRVYKTLIEVSRELDHELGIKPWQPGVLDFAVSTMEASRFPAHADFFTIAELHRRLAEA
jgi:hypothetical protein